MYTSTWRWCQIQREDMYTPSDTIQPHLKKPNLISHHLAVFIGHGFAELWCIFVRPLPKSDLPCMRKEGASGSLGPTKKSTSYSDLCGASRKARKRNPADKKPPNGQKHRKNGFKLTKNTAFWFCVYVNLRNSRRTGILGFYKRLWLFLGTFVRKKPQLDPPELEAVNAWLRPTHHAWFTRASLVGRLARARALTKNVLFQISKSHITVLSY